MNLKKRELTVKGIKFYIEEQGKEVARASLILIPNGLHKEPYGLIEDVFVDESFRRRGYATRILETLISEARQAGCYKIVATSRNERRKVHELYKKLGLKEHGKEFRMNF